MYSLGFLFDGGGGGDAKEKKSKVIGIRLQQING